MLQRVTSIAEEREEQRLGHGTPDCFESISHLSLVLDGLAPLHFLFSVTTHGQTCARHRIFFQEIAVP